MNDDINKQTNPPPPSEQSNGASSDNGSDAPIGASPRPEPSYGEITEGESGASLWQTIKIALRD